jgi:hypothetical protein
MWWAPLAAAQEPVQTVEGFEIFVHVGRDTAYDDLWEALPDRIAAVREMLGDEVLSGGEIHVLSNLNNYFQARDEDARAPRWAQALAMPSRRTVLLKMPDSAAIQTLTHELSHLAVDESAGGQHVPMWFMERFAMLQAEEWGLSRAITMGRSALFSSPLPFSGLDRSFPPHHLSASIAYAQSFHVVRELVSTFGEPAIRRWLDAVAAGTDWQLAFRSVFGIEPGRFFSEWRDSVQVWYAWIPGITSVTSLWIGIGLLAMWAYKCSRRRKQLQLMAMEIEERELYGRDPDDDLF